MILGGLQKLSLIDYPGKIAAVVFTQGCAFRCPYCHNPELIPVKTRGGLSEVLVLKHLKNNRDMLQGVCITGGETTLHPDLPLFLQKVRSLGLSVKLDTNGLNPKMVADILQQKLVDYWAMDIKHIWQRYHEIIKVSSKTVLGNIKKTFVLIQNSGVEHEFRTTVFPPLHSEDDFFTIAGYLRPGETYVLQDIRYDKTLEPNLDQSKSFDLPAVAKRLKQSYSQLTIFTR